MGILRAARAWQARTPILTSRTRVAPRARLVIVALFVALSSAARPAGVGPADSYRAYLPAVVTAESTFWGVETWPYSWFMSNSVADTVQAAGAGWMRAPINWNLVEPANTTPEKFDWAYHDALFGQAARIGVRTIAYLQTAPRWAAEVDRGPLRPGMLSEWLQFVRAAVERYSKPPYDVHFWEVYNEPDGTLSANAAWVGAWGEDPMGYAALLKATYPVIKQADPSGMVLMGTPSYDWFTDVGGLFVRGWLDIVFDPARGGTGPYFDIMGLHMYTLFRSEWEPFGRDIIGKTNSLRALMEKYGIRKPMMVTEMGQGSGGDATPERQARYAIKGAVRALAAGHQAVIWFCLFDFDSGKAGLLNDDGTPKPAVEAFRTMTTELRQPVYLAEAASRLGVDSAVEGYYFRASAGETLAIWVDDDQDRDATRLVRIPAGALRVVDRLGTVQVITDSDDGVADGVVTVRLTTEPRFVRRL